MPIYTIIANEPLNIKTLIFNILNLDVPYFWFLEALLCLYIFFPALKALFDKSKKAFVFFIAVCFVLTFGFVLGNQLLSFVGVVIHHPLGDLEYPLLTYFNLFHNNFGYAFVYFCFGGLVFIYKDKILAIPRKKRNIISILGIIISCGCLFLIGVYFTKTNNERWDVVWNGYDTVFTFLNVVFIYVLSLNYTKDNIFIRSISCNTLGIYLIHALFIRLTGTWMANQSFFCNLPSCALYAFVIMCVSLLICLIIRKVPIMNRLL